MRITIQMELKLTKTPAQVHTCTQYDHIIFIAASRLTNETRRCNEYIQLAYRHTYLIYVYEF